MDLLENLLINTYFLAVILVIAHQNHKHADNHDLGTRIFEAALLATAVTIIFDILSRFDGYPGTIYPLLNHAGNFLLFLSYPVLPAIWLLYVHYQIHHDRYGLRGLAIPLATVGVANTILVVASHYSGWLYTIDAENRYTRGPGFILPAVVLFGFLFAAAGLVLANRPKIEKRHFRPLLLFVLPPAIGVVLQMLIYGTNMMLGGVTISLLIVYLNIQNESLYTDHLTGTSNRRRLELDLKQRIRTVATEGTFAAIMLDLDNFKQINDRLGHHAGDEALETAVLLVRSSIRSHDFIARYGGDEFYILLDGIHDIHILEMVVGKIRQATQRYNNIPGRPFRIEFSMGYAIYDPSTAMDMDHFLKHVDALMYEDKRQKRIVAGLEKATVQPS